MQRWCYELENGRAPPQTAVRREMLFLLRRLTAGLCEVAVPVWIQWRVLSNPHMIALATTSYCSTRMDAEYEVGASATPYSSIRRL